MDIILKRFKDKISKFGVLSFSASNLGVFLFLNMIFPTSYFFYDIIYQMFFICSIGLVFLTWGILFLIKKKIYDKNKKIGFNIFLFFAGIFPYYFFYIICFFLGKKIFFTHNFLVFLFISIGLMFPLSTMISKKIKIVLLSKNVFIFFIPFVFFTFGNALYEIFTFKEDFNKSFFNLENGSKRIVYMVFDELDKQIAFDMDLGEIELEGFKKLKEKSFYAENCIPAGTATLRAIPSLTTGLKIKKAIPFNKNTLYIYTEKGKKNWRKEDNIFKWAKENKLNTTCLGWYHPYRRIFQNHLNYCYDNLFLGKDTLFHNLVIIGKKVLKKGCFNLFFSRNEDYGNKYQRFYDKAFSVLKNNEYNFIFIHWPFPHSPAIYDLKYLGGNRKSNGYLNNLIICDDIITRFFQEIDDDNTVLIVTSDHHLRMFVKNSFVDPININQRTKLLVPLLIKFPGEKKSFIYQKENNASIIPFIIKGIMTNKIKSNQDVAEFIDTF